MRGLKPDSCLTPFAAAAIQVARSAPPMRGLKRRLAPSRRVPQRPRRAIRPAYEGIETKKRSPFTDDT